MRIGHIVDDSMYRQGGVQNYIINFCNKLANEGHDITIIHCDNRGIQKKPIHLQQQIEIISLSNAFDIPKLNLNGSVSSFPGFAKRNSIQKVLKEKSFDVLHFYYPFSPFCSGRIIQEAGNLTSSPKIFCQFVLYVEEHLSARVGAKILYLLCRNKLKNVDRFLNISSMSEKFGKKYVGVQSITIPPSLEPINAPSQKDEENITILFIGRLEKRKGTIDLLQALKTIRNHDEETFERVCVYIAGDGPERKKLEKYVRAEKLNVTFLGRISEEKKEKLFRRAHITVFPAKYGESFGIVLVEAMRHGCVVLAYSNEGYADTLKHFGKECLITVNDVEELSIRLNELIKNKKKREELGLKLKEYFEQTFDIDKNVRKLFEVYHMK